MYAEFLANFITESELDMSKQHSKDSESMRSSNAIEDEEKETLTSELTLTGVPTPLRGAWLSGLQVDAIERRRRLTMYSAREVQMPGKFETGMASSRAPESYVCIYMSYCSWSYFLICINK